MRRLYLSQYTWNVNFYLLADERHLLSIDVDYNRLISKVHKADPGHEMVESRDQPLLSQARQQLQEYFDGSRRSFSVPFQMKGTDFQKKVWEYVRKIPHGETITYQQLARELGDSRLARAVGRAIGTNPLLILIPCHRVIRMDGQLGGYLGGIKLKRALLRLEKK